MKNGRFLNEKRGTVPNTVETSFASKGGGLGLIDSRCSGKEPAFLPEAVQPRFQGPFSTSRKYFLEGGT